jgi:hypothetical protein
MLRLNWSLNLTFWAEYGQWERLTLEDEGADGAIYHGYRS